MLIFYGINENKVNKHTIYNGSMDPLGVQLFSPLKSKNQPGFPLQLDKFQLQAIFELFWGGY